MSKDSQRKAPVSYDLCRQASKFHVYLLCLNAYLNRFLIVKVQVSAFNKEKAPASMGLLALWNFAKLRCRHRMNGWQSADRKGWLMDPRSPNEWWWWEAAPVVIADMKINMELAKHESEFISIDKSAWIFLVDLINKWHKSRYLTGDVTTIKADHAWHLLLFMWWWLHLWG